jgi:Ca-activated chloride channel family protein
MRLIHATALLTLVSTAALTGCGSASPKSYAPDSAAEPSGDDAAGAAAEAPMEDSVPLTGAAEHEPMAQAPMQQPIAADRATPSAPPPADTPATAKREERKSLAVQASPAQPTIAGNVPEPGGTEQYTDYGVNPFVDPAKDALSTFAIDVDTASYAIARSKLTSGSLPPFSAVRAEEFINYFDYGYAAPSRAPFAVHVDTAPSPYDKGHQLLRVGIQAKRIGSAERTPVHLVYLVDTSGSMQSEDKLGLAKKSLKLLTKQLKPGDTVALCTYAGSTRIVLPPTGANERSTILQAIDNLAAGGGTAMSSGVEMAYELAQRTLVKGHVNRVVVLSDGDANIGRTSHQQMLERIGHFKDQGITLSTVGFGRGNYKDTMMEQLANKGDGNYSYIDTEAEARKVFSEQLSGMLEVVARDVKIQVEFDPRVIARYRLVGYENRDVADEDFRNDAVDAGEVGAGHSVTALYEVVLKKNVAKGRSPVVVRLRHKAPSGSERAEEMRFLLDPAHVAARIEDAPASLRLAAGVAGFAEILRRSPHAKSWSLDAVERIVRGTRARNPGEQQELIALVRRAKGLIGASGSSHVLAK